MATKRMKKSKLVAEALEALYERRAESKEKKPVKRATKKTVGGFRVA